jgi:hypothetical protein
MSLVPFFERVLSQPTNDIATSRESTILVRETFYSPQIDVSELLVAIRNCRTTGRLIIDLGQGGVNCIRVREELNFDIT